jgi:hypothetical protein
VDAGDYDAAVGHRGGTINDQQVAVVNGGALHRIAGNADEEGGGRVADQVLVEVDPAFQVVVGRRGEAGGDADGQQRQLEPGGKVRLRPSPLPGAAHA